MNKQAVFEQTIAFYTTISQDFEKTVMVQVYLAKFESF